MNTLAEIILVAVVTAWLTIFVIAAVKGFTIGKTLRIMRWAWSHPWQRPPDDI